MTFSRISLCIGAFLSIGGIGWAQQLRPVPSKKQISRRPPLSDTCNRNILKHRLTRKSQHRQASYWNTLRLELTNCDRGLALAAFRTLRCLNFRRPASSPEYNFAQHCLPETCDPS